MLLPMSLLSCDMPSVAYAMRVVECLLLATMPPRQGSLVPIGRVERTIRQGGYAPPPRVMVQEKVYGAAGPHAFFCPFRTPSSIQPRRERGRGSGPSLASAPARTSTQPKRSHVLAR